MKVEKFELTNGIITVRPHQIRDVEPCFEAVRESMNELYPWMKWEGKWGLPLKGPLSREKLPQGKEKIVYLAKQEDAIAGFKPRLIFSVI